MKTINLREQYPDFYSTDTYIEVPDEVAAFMQEYDRKESAYFVLMNKGTDGRNRYGVKVRSNYDDAVALNLSERSERVFDLLDKLARNTVTPTGLPDVLADWRG